MKILVVDDDCLICENVKSKLHRIVSGGDLSCQTAVSVVEAKLLVQDQPPDILITDLNMPGISGISLIKYVKQHCPGTAVYVLSGYDDYHLVRQAFLSGADDYLLKPVDLEELREKLFRAEDAARPEAAAGDFQFESVLAFIDENICRDLTMDEAAANIAMSYNYFSKRFREVTGYSFPEYVNRRRIELSKAYLRDPSLRIADIAYKIGYHSPSSFSRAFRKYEGCYPSDYRNALGITAE
ncbi:MAG: helix-turn-helix domain-containing protein [Oscillospiraceae bacterium]|jgi:YesN/AraC family two-component response regulator|nr:helix-turn-helix domain-containing protein [Oscillospiraceae bacterium]